MTRSVDQKWQEVERKAQQTGRQLKAALLAAFEAEAEFLELQDGDNNNTFATRLGTPATSEHVADAVALYNAISELRDFVTDVANPVQGDRMNALRKFS